MKKIRCAISGISHPMLAEIMHRILDTNTNIEIISDVDAEELSSYARDKGINVVVTSFDIAGLPIACNELMEEVSDIAIVGLVEDGRKLCICMKDAGPSELMKLIQTVVKGKQKETNNLYVN